MSSIDREELRTLAAAYALDALDAEEARAFESLLASSPELQREVAEYREVSALLALEAPSETVSPPGWDRVEDRIVPVDRGVLPFRKGARGRQLRAVLTWAAAAAAVLTVGGLGLRVRDLSRQLNRARDSAVQASTQLAASEEILNEILGAQTVFTLTSTVAPEPAIRVYWNRETNVWVLHAANLTPAEAGRVYQLWFIRDGEPVPSITFNSEPDGQALVSLAAPLEIEGLTAAAVTEEPAGGSAQPTTAPILVGELGG